MTWLETIWALVSNRRVAVMVLLGFASGLPMALAGAALQAWLATAQVDVKTLGAATLLSIPYGFKFLWSPGLDRYAPPFLGRRRSWMLVMQLVVIGCCIGISGLPPPDDVETMAWVAVALAFAGASYDIAFDAYRTEVLQEHERGIGLAASIGGWRLGNLTSAGLALAMADSLGWATTYQWMGAMMLIGVGATLWIAPRPHDVAPPPKSLARAIVEPFTQFATAHRRKALLLLLLVVGYRLGDAFTTSLTTPFLVLPPPWLTEPLSLGLGIELDSGIGFTLTQVGLVNKGFAFASVLAGTAIGGVLMSRWSLFRCLVVFGVLQCFTNLAFLALSVAGPVVELLAGVVIVENVAGGLGTTALVALIMALCDTRYTATQFAFLSAVASLGRYVAASSGLIQDAVGWPGFFIVTSFIALPGLFLVFALRPTIDALETRTTDDG